MSIHSSDVETNSHNEAASKSGLLAEAFDHLHRRYGARLIASLTAMVRDTSTAEEIAARAFAKAYAHRAQFRGQAAAYTWLHAIARNEMHQYLRARRWISLDEIHERIAAKQDDGLQRLEKADAIACVRDALDQLPDIYGRVMSARFLDGLSTAEVAAMEQIPVGTVLSRVSKGKQLLRKRLESAP